MTSPDASVPLPAPSAVADPGPRAAAARRTALGRYGEEVARRYLVEEEGLVLLDRNWRCPAGEIDLVLRDGDDLVVAEVKTRTSVACGTPHEAVSPAKLARLRRLAAAWLAEHQARPRGVRIDMVAVLRPPKGAAVVEHVRGLG
jgi:putative endonuclease